MPNQLTARLAALVLLLPIAAVAQDRRSVSEPTFPASCTVLSAQLAIDGNEPSSETSFDTQRIQDALNACASGQAVELAVSGSNAAFLIQPITIPANVTLLVDGGVTVFASRNPADYQISGSGIETCGTVGVKGNGCKQLVNMMNGSALMGYGVIDGRGGDPLLVGGVAQAQNWWDLAAAANDGTHDQNNFVLLQSSGSPLTLYKITLRNSPMFHVVWHGSGFTAWGVKIATPYTARNTDGIDPSGLDITVTNASISDGDDMIAVSASSAAGYITVSNIQGYSGHGISIGSYTKGGLTNMLVDHVNLAGTVGDGSARALRIKSAQDRGGLVQNVTYQNVCAKDTAGNFILDPFYDSTAGTQLPQFQNIVLRNAHFLTEAKVTLQGYDAAHASSVTFDNVVFDHFSASDFSPAPENLALTLGPGSVYPATLQAPSGTNVTVAGSAPATTSGALDCTNAFPQLAGELFLQGNAKALTLDGPATFKLQATVQPAMSQVSYGAWTGVPALAGQVNFLEDGAIVGTGSLGANGTLATATLTNVGGGVHTYVAQYPGDANYGAMTFGSVTVTVNSSTVTTASTTQLTAPASASYGQPVTLSAAVSGAGAAPTGTVQFSSDGVSLGSAPLSSGTATLSIASLKIAAGSHSLKASYGGDAAYSASSSATQLISVSSAATATALSTPGQVFAGAPLALTATVTADGSTPEGNVTFMNGATPIATVALVNGAASTRVSAGAVGQLSLSASYAGTANYAASSAAAAVDVVAPFTLSAPPEATLPSQVTVTLTPQAGFTGAVDLSCSTPAASVTCSVSQPSVTLSGPATVMVSLGGSTGATALGFGAALLPLGMLAGSRRKRRALLIALAALGLSCAGSKSNPSQLVTITARGGGSTVTAQISVH